jgi:hypothetical protein
LQNVEIRHAKWRSRFFPADSSRIPTSIDASLGAGVCPPPPVPRARTGNKRPCPSGSSGIRVSRRTTLLEAGAVLIKSTQMLDRQRSDRVLFVISRLHHCLCAVAVCDVKIRALEMHKPRGAMREGHSNQAGVFRLIFAGVCRGGEEAKRTRERV